MQPDSDTTSAILSNIFLIAVVGLAIFFYLLILIRKRWKKGFLHDVSDNKKADK